jgi:hypothetical protein
MQGNFLITPILSLCLLALSSNGFAQSWPGGPGMPDAANTPTMSPQEKATISQNSLDQAPVGADDCESKFPFPASAKRDPYAENGQEICKKLQIRGQRMQCEVDSLLMEKPNASITTGSKIELAAWARCNSKVATLLIQGYYLPASEIERRLQICSADFYADPGKMPKLGWYQRFLKWATSNDLTPAPTDAALEVALKQSTPLESNQDAAGLMKCEWMFSRSRTPVIDVLPGGSQVDADGAGYTAPAKKSTVKRPASKTPTQGSIKP